MTKSEFDKLIVKFKKQGMGTLKLWKGYEALRPQYEIFKRATNLEGLNKLSEVCGKMQKIQAQIESLWKPHRRIIGVCTKCGGTRAPAVMGKESGLGCFNSDCYYFEVVRKRAS